MPICSKEINSGSWVSKAVKASLVLVLTIVLSSSGPSMTMAEELSADLTQLSLEDLMDIQIKAAFVHHIAKFVQWPEGTLADPGEPFGLYTMGEDRFDNAFDSFKGRMIHNRPLLVRKLDAVEDIPTDCRILFVGVMEEMEIQRVLSKVAGRAILTISDGTEFTESGGTIGLITVNNRIRFTINSLSAREAGLTISSNLLKLALSINGETQ